MSNHSYTRRPHLLDKRSLYLRRLVLEGVRIARRGHIGSAFSLVEILRVLYDEILTVRPKSPTWPNRDRFILSKGHGCLALYAVLADKGFFPKKELLEFCTFDGRLGGHPQYGKVPGVEASTGSLGHGLPIGVGIALSAQRDKKAYRTFVVVSDGECNEGSTWEAALMAAKHKLTNLFVLVDYDQMQSYGTTHEVLELEPFADKWRSFGFTVYRTDGHNPEKLTKLLTAVTRKKHTKPTVIICDTVKGRGFPFMEGNPAWHHKVKITDEELTILNAALDTL
jgi:transketolase